MFHRFEKICCVKTKKKKLRNMRCMLQFLFFSVFIGRQQTNSIGVYDYHESNLALYYRQYLFAIISPIISAQYTVYCAKK